MAAEQLYALTATDVERLRRLLSLVERGEPILDNRGRKPLYPARMICGALTSAAAACTGIFSKAKPAVLNVYSFSSTGIVDTGVDETVYNLSPAAATTDRWTVCEMDDITKKYVITAQFCS